MLTIDDTHRDMVMAVSQPQGEGYAPDKSRLVDFLGSYPPGDIALGELRGPMREETDSWLGRVSMGLPTQAATAAEAHRNLMLTKALDLSAKRKEPGARCRSSRTGNASSCASSRWRSRAQRHPRRAKRGKWDPDHRMIGSLPGSARPAGDDGHGSAGSCQVEVAAATSLPSSPVMRDSR